MARKNEPPELDFKLWPLHISARGSLAIIVAAGVIALVLWSARPF